MENISTSFQLVQKVTPGGCTDFRDCLAVEEPLEIHLLYSDKGVQVDKCISVTMRTPGNDEELGVGFLFTEGIIQNREQVEKTNSLPFTNKVNIYLGKGVTPLLGNAERNFYTTSSCGVCGKSSIEAISTVSVFSNEPDEIRISPALFYGLESILKKEQAVFNNTGGLHASALFDLSGNLLLLREDVGRHNALDKLIGKRFLDSMLPLNENILLLSGRASFELIQKAVMAGIRTIAAIGAPSTLASQLAESSGITLLGFLGKSRFNIYTGAQRIITDLPQ